MTDIAIRVDNLSKLYRIGAAQERHDTLRDALGARLRRQGRAGETNTIWALKDVSFEVQRGEVVGVIGRNGAGKSTLLKILSRITEPTSGRAEIHGRVGSLLEVGTGFHPELTGRENIYLNGAILGMKRTEIARRFDEIVAFAEVEKFLDTPVKRYSSGMYVRLAFAVAAHLEPEILLVDEVLAVGDAEFQRKCLGKMGSVAQEGRTVVFVSHNLVAVQSLCRTALWLERGTPKDYSSADEVTSRYIGQLGTQVREKTWQDLTVAPGSDSVRLRLARVVAADECASRTISLETPIRLEFEYWNLSGRTDHSVTVNLHTGEGVFVLSSRSSVFTAENGLVRAVCELPGNLLNDGLYLVSLIIAREYASWLASFDSVVNFEIHDGERAGAWLGKWPGVVRPVIAWQASQVYANVKSEAV